MRDAVPPKISKWPFLLGDGLLLWTACFIYIQSKLPMGALEVALATGCVVIGALLAILPFVLEYRALVNLAVSDQVSSLVGQIKNVEKVAAQISDATGRWQVVQEASEKTTRAAADITQRISAEARAFTEFLQQANDKEKSNLKLEAEKLKRGENDWLQMAVRMLDHVHALHTAGVRSGQTKLVEQLSQFQNACRDAARRVGLVPFMALPAEEFNAQRHQCLDGDGKTKTPPPGSKVLETVAAGYTYQGQVLRPVLVRVEPQPSGPKQDQLPLSETAQSMGS